MKSCFLRYALVAFSSIYVCLLTASLASAQASSDRLSCPELAPGAAAADEALCWFEADRRGLKECKKAEAGVSRCISQAVSWCADAALDSAPVANACFLACVHRGQLDEALSIADYLQSPSGSIEDCRKALKLVTVRVVSDPPGAEITVDGRFYDQAPVEVRLAGKWWNSQIVATFGSGEETRKVQASQQDLLKAFLRPACVMGDLLIRLPGQQQPGSAQPQPDGVAPSTGQEEEPTTGAAPLVDAADLDDSDTDGPELLPWVVIGASGAVAVTGAVLLGLAMKDKSTVEDAEDGTRLEDIEGAHDRVPELSTAGSVLLGVGLAGVAAGVILLTAAETEQDDGTSVALTPTGILVRSAL